MANPLHPNADFYAGPRHDMYGFPIVPRNAPPDDLRSYLDLYSREAYGMAPRVAPSHAEWDVNLRIPRMFAQQTETLEDGRALASLAGNGYRSSLGAVHAGPVITPLTLQGLEAAFASPGLRGFGLGDNGRGNSNDGSPTRGNSNDGSPTRGNSNDGSPTRTEVRSPTSTSTSTEVRSPTSTSTDAYTRGNITVTGGAGAGAYTNVRVYQGGPSSFPERAGRAAGFTQEMIVRDSARALVASRPGGTPIPLQTQMQQLEGAFGFGGLGSLGALVGSDPTLAFPSTGIAKVATLWAQRAANAWYAANGRATRVVTDGIAGAQTLNALKAVRLAWLATLPTPLSTSPRVVSMPTIVDRAHVTLPGDLASALTQLELVPDVAAHTAAPEPEAVVGTDPYTPSGGASGGVVLAVAAGLGLAMWWGRRR